MRTLTFVLFMLMSTRAYAGDGPMMFKTIGPQHGEGLAVEITPLAGDDPALEVELLLTPFLSDDAYSRAERPMLVPRTVQLLREIASRSAKAGDLELAAYSLDAAHTIADDWTRDPEYARILVAWADQLEHSEPRQALYLARRALRMDPDNDHAADLADDLGTSDLWPFIWTSQGIAAASAVTCIIFAVRAGMLASDIEAGGTRRQLDERIASRDTALTIVAITATTAVVGYLASVFMVMADEPPVPVSPMMLPALEGAR